MNLSAARPALQEIERQRQIPAACTYIRYGSRSISNTRADSIVIRPLNRS